jgi:hypothetical protein
MTVKRIEDVDGIDKTNWPPGPWDSEPDKIVWIDEATDLDCMIVRGPYGALCGYVGVPPGHPAYEQPYNNVHVEVHGGLTYADKCHGSICHVPQPGRTDDVWWLGFDCAHAMRDTIPGWTEMFPESMGWTYKDVKYVTEEVTRLAEQLRE